MIRAIFRNEIVLLPYQVRQRSRKPRLPLTATLLLAIALWPVAALVKPLQTALYIFDNPFRNRVHLALLGAIAVQAAARVIADDLKQSVTGLCFDGLAMAFRPAMGGLTI